MGQELNIIERDENYINPYKAETRKVVSRDLYNNNMMNVNLRNQHSDKKMPRNKYILWFQ